MDGEFYYSVTQNSDAYPLKVMIWCENGITFKTDLIFFVKNITSETDINEAIVGSHLKYKANFALDP